MPPRLTDEAVWDILLVAFTSPNEVVQTKELCASSNLADTTAFRWISVLEREGLLERAVHPTRTDRRAIFYRLTFAGRGYVEHALQAILRD